MLTPPQRLLLRTSFGVWRSLLAAAAVAATVARPASAQRVSGCDHAMLGSIEERLDENLTGYEALQRRHVGGRCESSE
jgi:hypothetical protein